MEKAEDEAKLTKQKIKNQKKREAAKKKKQQKKQLEKVREVAFDNTPFQCFDIVSMLINVCWL